MTKKVLCVDDEANILEAYQRGLRKQFDIETALGAEQALAKIDAQGPYAVVVSDMRMPGMDGIRLLSEIRQRAPDSVRVMLTGFADLQTTVEAVNEGNIFRFLTKPCPPQILAQALSAGIEQYRLVTAEKELLEKTLRGAVKVLTDVLSLTNPTAFGHASRVRRLVRKLCEELGIDDSWQFEIAAMLSQIGCVTVPPDTLDKVYHSRTLKPEEVQMLQAHPAIARDLVANIPRLENVAGIIAYQQKRFDGSGTPSESLAGSDIPLGARILKVALDYDTLKWSGDTDIQVMVELRQRSGWYDPEVLAALETVVGFETALEIQEIGLKDLTTYMIIAEDVTTTDGMLLVTKGQEVTPSLRQRLRNFAKSTRIKEPVHVLMQVKAGARTLHHSAPQL